MRCRSCGKFVDEVTGLCSVGCEMCGEQNWPPAPEEILDIEDIMGPDEPLFPNWKEDWT